MHNILQEAIVHLLSNVQSESSDIHNGGSGEENGGVFGTDKFTLMLGYTEIVGVLTFSYLERVYCTNEGGLSRVAPLRSYPLLTACLFASSSLSNLSLSYINFPTKVGKSPSSSPPWFPHYAALADDDLDSFLHGTSLSRIS